MMGIWLPREIKKAGAVILTILIAGLTGVWTYLEKVLPIHTKQELPTVYLIQLISSFTIIIVALLIFIAILLIRRNKSPDINHTSMHQPHEKETLKQTQSFEDLNRQILLQILKFRAMNQIASPRNIAPQLKQDVSIILAHLNKLHNEQYVTFHTGGMPPSEDTDFFLSPKAFDIVECGSKSRTIAGSASVTFYDPKHDKI
jgi:hypothetical protein